MKPQENSVVRFEYQYRDANNFKNWNELFFSNPNQRSAQSIEEKIRSTLFDKNWFIADQVQIPELFLFADSEATVADHCFHELIGIQLCSGTGPHENAGDSIDSFIERFQTAASIGWNAFDPMTRFI